MVPVYTLFDKLKVVTLPGLIKLLTSRNMLLSILQVHNVLRHANMWFITFILWYSTVPLHLKSIQNIPVKLILKLRHYFWLDPFLCNYWWSQNALHVCLKSRKSVYTRLLCKLCKQDGTGGVSCCHDCSVTFLYTFV